MSVSLLFLAFFSSAVFVDAGVIPDPPETKILGGHQIDIADAPWQVSLLVDSGHFCGGSIISPEWVLSAAHCTINIPLHWIQIQIGSTHKERGGTLYDVKEIVHHDKYVKMRGSDICVLKTTSQMRLDSPVKAVRLPDFDSKRPSVGTKLTVSGWGEMEDGANTDLLMKVDIVVVEYEQCEVYGANTSSTEICAGESPKGSCSGDSGGPLVDGDLQVGIVSWGNIPCDLYPSIYTDVAYFRDWIKEKTGV